MDVSRIPVDHNGARPAPADLLDRMVRAVERVRERMLRATAALEEAAVPYCVVGEQAVSAWISQVDEAAVTYSPAIDILLDRSDLDAAKRAMANAGFVFGHVEGSDSFLDRPGAKARDSVRVVFAGERARTGDLFAAPEMRDAERANLLPVSSLESLVKMKLSSYRRIDRVDIRDLIDVGLVDETWLSRLPAPLSDRLKELLDNPEG
jgi:hypothetical protein